MSKKLESKNKTRVSPVLSEKSGDWYLQNFDNLNQGATYVLEAMPALYRRALISLKGKFMLGELNLILDVENGTFLMGALAGDHVTANCADGIALDHLDAKWKINAENFLKKLNALNQFDLAVIEIWANAFWVNYEKIEMDEWVKTLV